MNGIFVIIDTIMNKPQASGFELISFAEKLAEIRSMTAWIIIAGENIRDTAEEAALSGHDVIGLEHEALRFPNPDLLARETMRLMDEHRPRYVCFQHTMRGCQAAAHLSAVAGVSCITGVESFTVKENRPVFRKSLFNGKINIDLAPAGEQSAVTVLPGAYAAPDTSEISRSPGLVEIRKIDGKSSPCKPLGISESVEESVRLEESDVIVSAGRGIGARENLDLIRAVAKLFLNAGVGASRTICDQKWLSYAHQVGVTGKTVSPKLYMACGISGAQQHIAGMKGSQTIVAINKDPQAAIFSIADYIIVEDLTTFLPILIQKGNEKY
ncbi:MAG: hypothetical protein A2176_15665 [Spirochaetes bacterium RBG_13_51_14]|nr:MAG: hypothetical protein A2176_15665 [Spirochaetes bacterium RBG_13_51_14]